MKDFHSGDVFAVRGKGIFGWACRNLFTPTTDRVHFGIIYDYVEEDKDYIILESIIGSMNKGMAVGRLSTYNMDDIEVYRVAGSDWENLGRRAATSLTKYGRAPYDHLLLIKVVFSCLRFLALGKLPPWKPEHIPYARDSRLICTEAANQAWAMVGKPIIPQGIVPLPAGFKQALDAGRLLRVYP